jgi:hypothetical protein
MLHFIFLNFIISFEYEKDMFLLHIELIQYKILSLMRALTND